MQSWKCLLAYGSGLTFSTPLHARVMHGSYPLEEQAKLCFLLPSDRSSDLVAADSDDFSNSASQNGHLEETSPSAPVLTSYRQIL